MVQVLKCGESMVRTKLLQAFDFVIRAAESPISEWSCKGTILMLDIFMIQA